MLTFFIIINVLWAVLHVYVARRLVAPLSLGRVGRFALCAPFVPLALTSPFVFEADTLGDPYSLVFRWVVWTYIGAFSILFMFVAFRDALMLALRPVEVVRRRSAKNSTPLLSVERRTFLLKSTGGAALGATAVLTGVGVRKARRVPKVVSVDVPIKGLPRELDGYHIVQLTDVHVGETIDKDFILPIVEEVTSLAPDMIAMTGDLVDGKVDRLRVDVSPFAYLRARDGVLFVTGNHEYYSGVDAWCAHYRELGMTVLINQHVVVERAGKRLVIAGVTDIREGKNHPGHASDPKRALEGAPPHDARILLAHQPRSAFEAQHLGYQLQISGHTHGGQFFPWSLLVHLVQPVAEGLGRIGEMWVYVSRGTCYWGPPIRTVPAEITSIKLRRA